MSDAHKEALAVGRRESRAIRRYLDAMASRRPGRPVTTETLKKRLSTIAGQLESESNSLTRVDLHQRLIDTRTQLAQLEDAADLDALEEGFVAAVGGYSSRKGISYQAWRAAGVPAAVLKKAGIGRGS
jgi:hypothetical protein